MHYYYGDKSRPQPSPFVFSYYAEARLRTKQARYYYRGTSETVRSEVIEDLRVALEGLVEQAHRTGLRRWLNTPGEAAFDAVVRHDGDHPFTAHVVYTVDPDYLQGEYVPCFTVHFVNLIPMVRSASDFHFALAA